MLNRSQNSNKKHNLENSYQKVSDNNNNQKKSSNLYSLKPQRLSIPKDVSTFSIFKTLLKEVNCNFPTMQKKIDLTHILLKNRLNIILKMKDFIIRYRLSSNSFFVAIYIMDSLIAKRLQLPIDKIGIGALVLAVKFIEIDGKMPSMNKFVDFMNNPSFTLNELIKIEIECLKKLNYVITMPNPIHFIQLFLVNGILFNTDVKGTNTVSSNIYTMPSQLLDYVMEENTNYFQFHPLSLACACVAQSREAYGIEKWNKILQEVFDITFDVFEREFYYVKE